jgi:integrase/recombinase XerC
MDTPSPQHSLFPTQTRPDASTAPVAAVEIVVVHTADRALQPADYAQRGGAPLQTPRPPSHIVTLRALAAQHTLALWAGRYLTEEVCGRQAVNTFEAKSRDLTAFVSWFVELNGTGCIDDWLPRDTQSYLDMLEAKGRAATTINRCFATLRHFARWVNDQPGGVFHAVGLPTRGIQDLTVDEPDCKKLDRREVHRLFKAADRLVLTELRQNQRPRRNRAILALLYYTGLRVSELVALKRTQYDGRYLLNVKRKGRARSKGLYISIDCRALLDDYIAKERPRDAGRGLASVAGALVVPNGSSGPLTRRTVAIVLDHIAQEASKHPGARPLTIHPHRLRHTFGAEYRERTGSDTETAAALGHTGLGYVGRYVRKTQEEREKILDAF